MEGPFREQVGPPPLISPRGAPQEGTDASAIGTALGTGAQGPFLVFKGSAAVTPGLLQGFLLLSSTPALSTISPSPASWGPLKI